MSDSADVVVVGGGAVGCAIAHALARRHVPVVLLERGRIGGGASYGAGGMLAPQVEARGPGPLLDLGLESRALFAPLQEALPFGFDLDFSGILRVAADTAGAEQLRERVRWQQAAGLEARMLDPSEMRSLCPAAADALAGMWVPDGQVSPLRLTLALAAGATRSGADLREGVTVRGVGTGGVDTTAGRISCQTVVVAGGAWSGALTGLPVGPLKGQRLLVREIRRSLGCILWGDGAYLVPKPGGGILIGATEEPDAGFDPRVTLGATQRLSAAAIALMPTLAASELVETWAGFRPTTPDHLPVLGPIPHLAGVWVASGHHRNGILLAPLTGELIARALTSGADLPASCAPGRFAACATNDAGGADPGR